MRRCAHDPGDGHRRGRIPRRRARAAARRPRRRRAHRRSAAPRRPTFPHAGALDLHDRDAIARAAGRRRGRTWWSHAAGRTARHARRLMADNAVATANLAEAIGEATPGAGLVLLGSAAQYGAARTADALEGERPLRAARALRALEAGRRDRGLRGGAPAGLPGDGARLFNVVAPEPQGEQVFATFLRRGAAAAAAGPPPWRVGDGRRWARCATSSTLEDVLTRGRAGDRRAAPGARRSTSAPASAAPRGRLIGRRGRARPAAGVMIEEAAATAAPQRRLVGRRSSQVRGAAGLSAIRRPRAGDAPRGGLAGDGRRRRLGEAADARSRA